MYIRILLVAILLLAHFLAGCVRASAGELLVTWRDVLGDAKPSNPLIEAAAIEARAWLRSLPGDGSINEDDWDDRIPRFAMSLDAEWFWVRSPDRVPGLKEPSDRGSTEAASSSRAMLWRRDGAAWKRVPISVTAAPVHYSSSGSLIVLSDGTVHRISGDQLQDLHIPPGGASTASESGWIVTMRPSQMSSAGTHRVEVRHVDGAGAIRVVAESDFRRQPTRWPWPTFVWAEDGQSVVVCSSVRVRLPAGTIESWAGADFRTSTSVAGGAVINELDDIVKVLSDGTVRVIHDFAPPETGRHFVFKTSPSGRQMVFQRPTAGFLGTDRNALWLIDVVPGMSFPSSGGVRGAWGGGCWVRAGQLP